MVVRMRHNKSQRNQRRSHHALKPQKFLNCPKCAKPVLAHTACVFCGFYKGIEIINVLTKLDKKEKKKKEKMAAKRK